MDLTRERTYTKPKRASGNAFLKSFSYAFEGLAHVVRTQRNFRVQLALAATALAAGMALGLNGLELAVVSLAIAFVTVAEMLNTVVESVVNLVTSNYDPRAKIAKDVSAGAVLLAAVWSIVIAVLIFRPHVLELIG